MSVALSIPVKGTRHHGDRDRLNYTLKSAHLLAVRQIIDHSRPTYEVVYAWSQSFENLMKNKLGQKYFAEFLKGEYSDENILFWQACEELKREKNAEKIEEKKSLLNTHHRPAMEPYWSEQSEQREEKEKKQSEKEQPIQWRFGEHNVERR
ncbi:regulator of G protein signaling domain protein [Cooperia oncophora]